MSNLLDKSSIVLTPTAYDNGKVLCVKPSDASGDFQFSRNSAATRVNAQGLVEDVQILSGNKVTNGDFSNGSTDWIIEAAWTISGGVANGNGANGSAQELIQNPALITGKTYTITYEVKNYVSGSVKLRKPAGTTRTANGVYTEILLANGLAIIFRGTNFNGSITNIIAKEITNDTNLPRINYEGGCGSWLFEPQSTNLVTQSETYGSGTFFSFTSGSTIDNTTSLSPSGENNATQITSTGDGKIQSIALTTLSQNTDYSFSFYAKNVDATAVTSRVLAIGGSGGSNLTAISYVSELSTENWVRITHYFNTGTNTTFYLFMSNALNSGGTIQLWGAQLEQQTYSTSYIPTSGTSVTRNQDLCNNGGTGTGLINSTEGVLYAEIAANSDDLTGRVISLSDGTSNERIVLSYNNSTNKIRCFIKSGGSFFATLDKVVADEKQFHKVAYKYKSGETKLFVDGNLVDTSTDAFTITGLDVLQFANGTTTTQPFFGKTKCLAVWKETLSDEELAELTTI